MAAFFLSFQAHALDPAAVEKLAFGDGDDKVEAIGALGAEGDARAAELLKAFAHGELQTSGKQIFIVRGDKAIDVFTAKPIALPKEREDVVANNRLRGAVASALGAFKLGSEDRNERLAAARALSDAGAAMLPLIRKALEKETDPEIRGLLDMTAAGMELKDGAIWLS